MRKLLLGILVAGGAVVVTGCSSGYPSTDDRCEAIQEEITKGKLPTEPNATRDQRFKDTVRLDGK